MGGLGGRDSATAAQRSIIKPARRSARWALVARAVAEQSKRMSLS